MFIDEDEESEVVLSEAKESVKVNKLGWTSFLTVVYILIIEFLSCLLLLLLLLFFFFCQKRPLTTPKGPPTKIARVEAGLCCTSSKCQG